MYVFWRLFDYLTKYMNCMRSTVIPSSLAVFRLHTSFTNLLTLWLLTLRRSIFFCILIPESRTAFSSNTRVWGPPGKIKSCRR